MTDAICESFNLYGLVQYQDHRALPLQYKQTKDYLQDDMRKQQAAQKAAEYIKEDIEEKKTFKAFNSQTQNKSGVYADERVAKTKQPMGSGKKSGGLLFNIKKKGKGVPGPKLNLYD